MKDDKQIDMSDFADILATTLALAADTDIRVGIRNAPANDRRPAGLLIYISNLAVDIDGRIGAAVTEEKTG